MPIYYPKECQSCSYGCEARVRLFSEEVSCDTGGVPVGDCETECSINIDIQPYTGEEEGEMIKFEPSGRCVDSSYYFYYQPEDNECGDEFIITSENVTLIEYLDHWYQVISIKSWKGDCGNCSGISHQEGMLRLYEECEESAPPVEYCIPETDDSWTRHG